MNLSVYGGGLLWLGHCGVHGEGWRDDGGLDQVGGSERRNVGFLT